MTPRKTELIVGVFALVIFAGLTFITFKVGDFSFGQRDGYAVKAIFRNTAGLDPLTKIKVAGVNAGQIEDISLQGGKAVITLRIDPGIKLYSDATASIRSSGLLGDKYMELMVGSRGPLLKDGDTIKNIKELVDMDEIVRDLSNLSNTVAEVVSNLNDPEVQDALKATILNLRDITEYLNGMVSENRSSLGSIIKRIDRLTASLDTIVADSREPLANTLVNLEKMTSSGSDLVEDLTQTVTDLQEMVEHSRGDFENLLSKTNSTMNSVSFIAGKVERGEGTLGKLINDDTLYTSMASTLDNLDATLSGMQRFRTFITFRGDYLGGVSDAKGEFYLTMQPRRSKYFILGVISDPTGNVEETLTITDGEPSIEQRITNDLEFTAQYARRYKNTALRIGLTENTFGIGADQFMFDDRLKLSLDAWDFGLEEHNAVSPHLTIKLDYFIFKNFFVSSGVDNILNPDSVGASVGVGVRFEDEDLKYLLGTMPSIAR